MQFHFDSHHQPIRTHQPIRVGLYREGKDRRHDEVIDAGVLRLRNLCSSVLRVCSDGNGPSILVTRFVEVLSSTALARATFADDIVGIGGQLKGLRVVARVMDGLPDRGLELVDTRA